MERSIDTETCPIIGDRDKCFVVVVDKTWYEGFIPFFIFFANKSYPNADILVYVRGSLHEDIATSIQHIDVPSDKYIIIENWKTDYPASPLFSKISRWVIDDDNIRRYRYAYIGDIDIMICQEAKDLFESHIIHSEIIELPYSNIVRPGGGFICSL